jgi:hypothetical protein
MEGDEIELLSDQTHLLRCAICHKAIMISEKEVMLYVRLGWPHCCTEVMSVEKDRRAKQRPRIPNS